MFWEGCSKGKVNASTSNLKSFIMWLILRSNKFESAQYYLFTRTCKQVHNFVTSYSAMILLKKITLFFSPFHSAEPLKKKKKVDPALVKSREERRKRRVEKEIKKLKKTAQQLKPIDELEIPFNLISQKE